MVFFFFFLNVDQFETKFWAGAPPHAKYIGKGITYKKGGKFAGHGSCMAEVCAVSPVPSLFAFWVVLRKVWVEALIWNAVKVVWGRVVLVVVVLCAAGMTEVWLAVNWSWAVSMNNFGKMIFFALGTLVDPPLAPTVLGPSCPPTPPSDHSYGGLGVSLCDSEAWKPQKVGLNGSKQAQNDLISLVCAPQMVQDQFWKITFLTPF